MSSGSSIPDPDGSYSVPWWESSSLGSSSEPRPDTYYGTLKVWAVRFDIWPHLNMRVQMTSTGDSVGDVDAGDGLGPNASSLPEAGGWFEERPTDVFYSSDQGEVPTSWPDGISAEIPWLDDPGPDPHTIRGSTWFFNNLDRYTFMVVAGELSPDVTIHFSAEWKPPHPDDIVPDPDFGFADIGYVYFIAEYTRYPDGGPPVTSRKWVKSYVASTGRPASTRRVSVQIFLDGFWNIFEDYAGD